jgi:hypothetical protein
LSVYFRQERGKGSKEEHSDTHQVVSEQDFTCIFQVKREGKGRQSIGDSVDCLQVGNNQEDSQEDCRMKLETLLVQSDSSRFARRADRDNAMATEGHRHAGRKRL